MSYEKSHNNQIGHLREIADLFENPYDRTRRPMIQVYNRDNNSCRKHLTPNRRDFFQIIFFDQGDGMLTIGLNSYHIDHPALAFIHPNEIITWENTGLASTGHICLFKKDFLEEYPSLGSIAEKYAVFTDPAKQLVQLPPEEAALLRELFAKMHLEQAGTSQRSMDALQAYMQLIIITGSQKGQLPGPLQSNPEHRHIHDFFSLLEKETSGVSNTKPVRLKTVQEFAEVLALHPNYLNVLLKKHTGENVSTHIKKRLLQESKVLLVQTNWTLQDIAYAVGFSAQPSFTQSFKKAVGISPTEFRRSKMSNTHNN